MNIGELIAYIRIDNKQAKEGLGEVQKGMMVLDRSILEASGPLDQFFSVANLPLMLQGVDAVWQMSGVIGLIPSVAGAAALAIGAVKIATAGMGDAMKNIRDPKAFAESIKEMDPALQDVMISLQKLIPAWDTMKKRVQGAFWSNLNTHIDLLGSKYLPVLNTGLFKTANGLNRGASATAQFLEESQQVDDVSHSFDNMSVFTEKLAGTFPNLIGVLLDFVTVGSDSLPALGDYVVQLIDKFTAFIQRARETGQLGRWIKSGIESLKTFGQIVYNIGAILVGVFNASGQSGGGLLLTLQNLTANMLAFVRSSEGQEKIGAIFQMLGQVSFPLLTLIPLIVNAFFTLAQIFTSLPGPIQSVLGLMLGWGGVAAIVIAKVTSIAQVFSLLKWAKLTTAATTVASWATIVATTIAQGAVMIGSLTATAAKYVAQWAIMAAGAMARAAIMAASWVIAMGPIGWVIAAIVGLVALIIWKWDEVVAITKKVFGAIWEFLKWIWGGIQTAFKAALDFIVNLFMNWTLPGLIIKHWDKIKEIFGNGIKAVVDFMKRLPGMIWSAIENLFGMMRDAGKRIIQSIIDGIKSMIGAVGDAIGSVASKIRGALPFSPAKWGPLSGTGSPELAGRRIGDMIAAGIQASNGGIERAMAEITSRVMPQIQAQIPAGVLQGVHIRDGVFEGVTEAFRGIRLEILGDGTARLVNTTNLAQQRRM